MRKNTMIFASVMMLLAVVLGAFGAHALKEVLTKVQLESFKTGVRYQMIHAIALIIFSLPTFEFLKGRNWILRLFQWGIVLFSFSIYMLTLGNLLELTLLKKVMGPITPLGGFGLIVAWSMVVVNLIKIENPDS